MAAKKLTRQEIKEDKFLTTMLEGYKYTQQHSSSVIVIGVIVVVVVVAVWGFFSYRTSREQRALNTLGIAELAYRTQNIAEATDSLKSLTEHYASTKAGREGWFALGHLYYIQGMYDEAITAYENYLKKPLEDDDLKAGAMVGIAACMEEKGEYKTAADKYEEVRTSFPDFFQKQETMLSEARCLEFSGDREKALELYKEFLNDYPDSPHKSRVQISVGKLEAAAL